jgi:Permeases of the drug/metabolite transporter (DMT) superfamily
MKSDNKITAHLLAGFCVVVWGSAMVSTKMLLQLMTPQELLFWRFLLGYFTLWLLYPKRLRLKDKKHEMICFLCGFTGVTLYFLCQNVALTMTQASNISVIISISPMLTAILSKYISRTEQFGRNFMIGFLLSMLGIILVVFNRNAALQFNSTGDLLAVAAAMVWAVYSILISKLKEYPSLAITRKCFFYGLLSMLPVLVVTDFKPDVMLWVIRYPNIMHLLFMGCIASALCYGIWNKSFYSLGVVNTNAYLYALPVVTTLFSILFLNEKINLQAAIGILMTIAGLFLSQRKEKGQEKRNKNNIEGRTE